MLWRGEGVCYFEIMKERFDLNTYRLRFITVSLLALAALGLVACGGETTTTVVETVVVEKEVVVEVEKEVIKEVEVEVE